MINSKNIVKIIGILSILGIVGFDEKYRVHFSNKEIDVTLDPSLTTQAISSMCEDSPIE